MTIKEIERQLDAGGILGNFPRIGKLRKGAEKPDDLKKGLKDLDYFRMTLEDEHEKAGIVRPAFETLYGANPSVFNNVLIAASDANSAFQYAYELWTHARLLRRCDGEEVHMLWNEGAGVYESSSCGCNPQKRECKQTGRLEIVLPELCQMTGVWGKFTIETHSIYDIMALAKSMRVAGAILGNMPNVALEFVPFTIGRAMRKVPVTINGKRIIKPMSLLFAMIEPEFNKQVVTQQLTRPAQLLLAGVNPETGESPEGGLPDIEAEFTQAASWDRAYINEKTIHFFDHENHQQNGIDKMIADGLLPDDLDDMQAIDTIIIERNKREAEKASGNGSKSHKKGSNSSAVNEQARPGAEWIKDTARLNGFIAKAHSELGLNTGDVAQALRIASEPAEMENIQDFVGSDLQAWASCVAFKYGYNSTDLGDIYAEDSKVRQAAQRIIDARAQRLQDIPF